MAEEAPEAVEAVEAVVAAEVLWALETKVVERFAEAEGG